MDLQNITIIVPTKNEEKNIPSFVSSLPPMVQLIVVDASSDSTPDLIRQIRPENTKIVYSHARIAEARNLGVDMARSRWLLFTDADCSFPPDYFPALHFLWPADAYYGPKISDGPYQQYYRNFSLWQERFDRFGIPAVSGSNFLVRRDVFQAVGRFDPQLLVNEDTELGFRLKKFGYWISFTPRLRVIANDHRRIVRGAFRKHLHSLSRCSLIYLDLFPRLWRGKDWGYW